ncbi:protein PHOX1-like [Triticum aestivum]|uniref:protein PHOX1-like n=1 Tax=Triticum aestivum TaxID=4565 RepID=UPI001D00F6F2|nr:protein PHOX1-like [Triticum aestivum]
MSSEQEHPETSELEEEAEKDEDAAIVELVTELKQEGTTLFRLRDYDGAAFKFDEAIRLSPRAPRAYNENDIASLHSNVAACYMHMNAHRPEDDYHYHQAIDRCNMALDASPRYTKALLKRARCFEALDRLDLACVDVQEVLTLEPNNAVALELLENLREEMEEKKFLLEQEARSLDDLIKVISASEKVAKQFSCTIATAADPAKKAVSTETDDQDAEAILIHGDGEQDDEQASYDDNDGEEAPSGQTEEEAHVGDQSGQNKQEDGDNAEHGSGATRCVELFLGEEGDVRRIALLPQDGGLAQLMDIARSKFPDLKELSVNFKDDRGDLVTVDSTTDQSAWFDEANSRSQGPLRLYVTEDNDGLTLDVIVRPIKIGYLVTFELATPTILKVTAFNDEDVEESRRNDRENVTNPIHNEEYGGNSEIPKGALDGKPIDVHGGQKEALHALQSRYYYKVADGKNNETSRAELENFSQWVLDLGNGALPAGFIYVVPMSALVGEDISKLHAEHGF